MTGKRQQCWHNTLLGVACEKDARWRSPRHMCTGIAWDFVAAVRWCDDHKHDGDVLITDDET